MVDLSYKNAHTTRLVQLATALLTIQMFWKESSIVHSFPIDEDTDIWQYGSVHHHHTKSARNPKIAPHCGRTRYLPESQSKGLHIGGYHRSIDKRIVGGVESRPAEWPWLVSLQLKPVGHDDKVKRSELVEEPTGPSSHDQIDSIGGEDDYNSDLFADFNDPELLAALLAHSSKLDVDLREIAPNASLFQSLEGHVCAGALISTTWILTAAHCFDYRYNIFLSNSPDRWIAKVGESNLASEDVDEKEYQIAKIVPYPQENGYKDIALVKLAEPVELSALVNYVCLPYQREVYREDQVCSVAGWGAVEPGGGYSNSLRHINISLIPWSACEVIYADQASMLPKGEEREYSFCAQAQNQAQSSCEFDSGGPMVCRSAFDQAYVATGLVSGGIQCASKYPSIYTRVAYFLPWIEQVTTTQ